MSTYLVITTLGARVGLYVATSEAQALVLSGAEGAIATEILAPFPGRYAPISFSRATVDATSSARRRIAA